MNPFKTILSYACGETLPAEDEGNARRAQLAIAAIGASVLLAMVWGLAAGSSSAELLIGNAYKVPVMVLASSAFALPAGLLVWRFSGAPVRSSDLLLAFASAVFAATLVLAVLSPLVALYYRSSVWAGPMVGQGSVILAVICGSILFARNIAKRAKAEGRFKVIAAAITFPAMMLATILQLIALFHPILPERTIFDRGIDQVAAPATEHGAKGDR